MKNWQKDMIIWQVVAEICHHTKDHIDVHTWYLENGTWKLENGKWRIFIWINVKIGIDIRNCSKYNSPFVNFFFFGELKLFIFKRKLKNIHNLWLCKLVQYFYTFKRSFCMVYQFACRKCYQSDEIEIYPFFNKMYYDWL